MGYPLTLALRYLLSKKRNMISISTALAVLGVTLGVAALAIVMSVTGGFQEQFRDKVLGVNAHVLVLKYSIDFREYRKVLEGRQRDSGRLSAAPLRHQPDDAHAWRAHGHRRPSQGRRPIEAPPAPERDWVLDLPKHITRGRLENLRRADAKPAAPNPTLLHPYDHDGPFDPGELGDALEKNPRTRPRTPTLPPRCVRLLRLPLRHPRRTTPGLELPRRPCQANAGDRRRGDAGRRLQEPAPRGRHPSRRYRSRPVQEPRAGRQHARHRRGRDAGEAARRRPRRLRPGHVAPDRALVRPGAAAHREAVPGDRDLQGRLRPVRLEARLHRPLRGAGVLRVRRQRDGHRDEASTTSTGPTTSRPSFSCA